ncbi:MAG: beta-lactamase family protein [candidate division WOR-3 bacterium]|nr:MAG: beta-lactamase family protein [candidate division WOR-3 bacterium]
MPFRELDNYLTGLVDKTKIPGFVCWVGNLSASFFLRTHGYAQLKPQKVQIKKDTVFDLASLTKPLVTALSVMLLHEDKSLSIDQTLDTLLPVFIRTPSARKTVRQLLTHTAGLPAWHPIYLFPEDKRLRYLAGLNTPTKEPVYSCLGYLILGKLIEHVSTTPLDCFFKQRITRELGLHTLGFGPVFDRNTAAATEDGNEHERKMASRHGDISNIKWREYLIQGEVHDGNAYYGYNGIAGNSGLFSNLPDLITLTRAYLSAEILKPSTLSMMTSEYVGSNEKRNLGWHADPYPGLLSPTSFGHTGFTGTMITIDPRTNLIIILLANAIHPKVQLGLMQPIRHAVVRIIAKTMRSKNTKL